MVDFRFASVKSAKKTKVKFPFSLHALIATWFYTGKSPVAPGTVGSLAVYPLYLLVVNLVETTAAAEKIFLLLAIFFTLLGTWATAKLQKQIRVHDHQCIVIDEVVGMLVIFALTMGPLTSMVFALDSRFNFNILPVHMVFFISFVVFRYFDIRKPLFIRALDRKLHKPIGVILDDIMAALLACVVIYIVSLIVPLII